MLFIGDDWAEAHHDIEIEDESGGGAGEGGGGGAGRVHGAARAGRGASRPAGEPDQVLVGIETERGPWVQALLAAGYVVYRDQPVAGGPLSGAALDVGGEVRSGGCASAGRDRPAGPGHHRPVAGDSEIAEHVKVAARAHQTMIWSRVRQVNALRSLLREYYPAALAAFGTDLADRDALAVLAAAPTPEQGRRLSQARIETLLRKAGRQRNLAATAEDQDRARLGAADRPTRRGAGLCRQRVGAGRGADHHGDPDRGAGRAGGAGFWPAPGR